jgi:hypothetical protein
VVLRDHGEIRNSPMHRKGTEEASRLGSPEGQLGSGTMVMWWHSGEVGVASLARRPALKVRTAPGPACGGEQMVVRSGDGRRGEMETGDGSGLLLTGNNDRVARA